MDDDLLCKGSVTEGVAQARNEARTRLHREDSDVSDRFRRRPRPSARVWAVP